MNLRACIYLIASLSTRASKHMAMPTLRTSCCTCTCAGHGDRCNNRPLRANGLEQHKQSIQRSRSQASIAIVKPPRKAHHYFAQLQVCAACLSLPRAAYKGSKRE